jgi:hypothetical protein
MQELMKFFYLLIKISNFLLIIIGQYLFSTTIQFAKNLDIRL